MASWARLDRSFSMPVLQSCGIFRERLGSDHISFGGAGPQITVSSLRAGEMVDVFHRYSASPRSEPDLPSEKRVQVCLSIGPSALKLTSNVTVESFFKDKIPTVISWYSIEHLVFYTQVTWSERV